jgi:hypothetical protein
MLLQQLLLPVTDATNGHYPGPNLVIERSSLFVFFDIDFYDISVRTLRDRNEVDQQIKAQQQPVKVMRAIKVACIHAMKDVVAVERALRDRIRTQLGLPEWSVAIDPKARAQELGIRASSISISILR